MGNQGEFDLPVAFDLPLRKKKVLFTTLVSCLMLVSKFSMERVRVREMKFFEESQEFSDFSSISGALHSIPNQRKNKEWERTSNYIRINAHQTNLSSLVVVDLGHQNQYFTSPPL